MQISNKAPQQFTLNIKLRDGFRFDSFCCGESAPNAEVLTLLQDFLSIRNKAQQAVIWGASLSGKTHLLQAACAKDSEAQQVVSYIPLKIIKQSGIEVLSGHNQAHLIVIDDIDQVVGDLTWETALFNLINESRENKQLLLMSMTQNPRMLECQLPDLASRLIWGSSYQIQALSDEETLTALQLRAKKRGFELNDLVISYLHRRYPRDIESLMEVLDKLDEASLQQKARITIPFVKKVLEQVNN